MGEREGAAWLHSGLLTVCSPCRQSMSLLSGPLQVVPDIDDQVANPEHPQEVPECVCVCGEGYLSVCECV